MAARWTDAFSCGAPIFGVGWCSRAMHYCFILFLEFGFGAQGGADSALCNSAPTVLANALARGRACVGCRRLLIAR